MRTRTKLVSLAVVACLALTGAGSALAEPTPPPQGGQPTAEQIALRCERGAQWLERLNHRAARLADRIVAVEAKIASGELTEEQLAKAQDWLARLEQRPTKLGGGMGTLGGQPARECGGGESCLPPPGGGVGRAFL